MEKRGWKKIFFSRLLLAGLLVFFILLAIGFARAFYRDYNIRQEITRLREEARRLEAKKISSLEILKFVQSPAFAEEKARTELNMAKPGETTTIIERYQPAAPRDGQTAPDVLSSNNAPNAIKWWIFFFSEKND